jgi:glutamate-1-semialdehyde aminotransferase
MTWSQSEKLFAEALKCISGGVNSPVRAFVRVEHGLMAGEFFLKP